jgi:uncharacterized protein (TIGR01777 family)
MQENEAPGRVLMSGATGLVGSQLVSALLEGGWVIRSLSRSSGPGRPGVERIQWDGVDPGAEALEEVDAVVHLAGEPIFGGLPTKARLDRVYDSRVDSTNALVDRIEAMSAEARPRVFVCASAVGYYGDRGEETLDESSAPGEGTLARVCRDWEASAARAESLGVRVVSVRIGVVLSKEGGALSLMQLPFRLGLGGRLGSGRQFFPWIHIDDLVGILCWCLEGDVSGPVNAVAPAASRNLDLTRALGEVLGRPTILPVPGVALKLVLGELASELLGSRQVVPQKLLDARYDFLHPTLRTALAAELR